MVEPAVGNPRGLVGKAGKMITRVMASELVCGRRLESAAGTLLYSADDRPCVFVVWVPMSGRGVFASGG